MKEHAGCEQQSQSRATPRPAAQPTKAHKARTPAERLVSKLNSTRFEQELKRSAYEQAQKRAQRRKELLERPIKADYRLVAWIDILGFSQQLQAIKTDAELQAAYRKLLFVHEWFDKESASDEPEILAEANRSQGRSVMALSDGLLVTASVSASTPHLYSPFDLLMSLVDQILLAQTACAMKGIFLRGGISTGPYYFEDDFLLSPAVVRAYKLESERARYPVIVLTPETINELRSAQGVEAHAEDPSVTYFSPFKSPHQKKGERFYFLDYVRYMAAPDNYFFDSLADRDAAANRTIPREERQRIFNESHDMSALKALQCHHRHLVTAYNSATSERVRAKYRWLMRYHNRTLESISRFYDPALIDLASFSQI
jgi:hypothetical protein